MRNIVGRVGTGVFPVVDLWQRKRIFRSPDGSQSRLHICFARSAFRSRTGGNDDGGSDAGRRAGDVEVSRLPIRADSHCDHHLRPCELPCIGEADEYQVAVDHHYDPRAVPGPIALVCMGPEQHLNGAELS